MPKEKMSVTNRLRSYVREFGANIFAIDVSVLLCKFCDIKINHEKRFNITQHLKTEKHLNSVKRAVIGCDKKKQQLVTNTTNSFNKDLCFALMSANIPLNKLSNESFRNFLKMCTGKDVPTEATLRLGYIIEIFEKTMDKIKFELLSKKNMV
jgi:hypothetical protein